MVLAVFAGLPGVGKSTLAARVAAVMPAAVLAVDTVDFTLRRYDVSEPRPGYTPYGVVAALAEVQLRIGHHVIIDAVNPVRSARQLWVDLSERLDVPLRVVEVVCGDDTEHRRRVEARYAAVSTENALARRRVRALPGPAPGRGHLPGRGAGRPGGRVPRSAGPQLIRRTSKAVPSWATNCWPVSRHQARMSLAAAGSSASTRITAPTSSARMCRASSMIGRGQR